MTLLEQLAEELYLSRNSFVNIPWDDLAKAVYIAEAERILSLINSHPETVERRERDFEAGKMRGIWELIQLEGASQIENMPPNIDDYLAAEKGEK